jgi:CheY-like chemotaxis protein/two-component sensor histidine kinase
VAHEVNNQLTVINGYSQMITAGLAPDSPLLDDMHEIYRAGERAANLTGQLLAFSRRQMSRPRVMNLNHTLDNMGKVLRRLIGEDIELLMALDDDIGRVKMDPGQIEQIVINLALNARHAMPDGGRITIATHMAMFADDEPKSVEARAGRFVCLAIADTGMGIDEGMREHLFEPFYTTKEDGTGLGLAVVYGIVKQNEGWIDVTSRPGRGTAFRIYLPDVSEAEEPPAPATPLHGLRGDGERILLVEDEDGVRELASRMLRRNGYTVLEAASAAEALAVYEAEEGRFALVFSDVVLTDTSGVQLVGRLLQRDPSLRILLTSGYADQKSQWATIRDKGYRFLPKPYPLADLLRMVKETLESAPAPAS